MGLGGHTWYGPLNHEGPNTSYVQFTEGTDWDVGPPSSIDPTLIVPAKQPDSFPYLQDTITSKGDSAQSLDASTRFLDEMNNSMSEMDYGADASRGAGNPATSFTTMSSTATATPSDTTTEGPTTPHDPLAHDITSKSPTAYDNVATSSSRTATAARSRLRTPNGVVKAKKPAQRKKARAPCSDCGKSFQPPKSTDTTLCHPCRTKQDASATLLASVATPGPNGDGTITLPPNFAVTALSKQWDARVTNAEDATNQLHNKAHYSIQIFGDDVATVDPQMIDRLSKDLFAALLKAPLQPSKDLDECKKAKYRDSQLDAYAKCANMMQTDEEVGDASARCRLAVEDAIMLHRDGIRLNELTKESAASLQQQQHETKKKNRQPAKPKTRTGFNMDVNVSCTQRIYIMIKAVGENKLVALELLDGRKVLDFVRCPTNFHERKMDNFKCNRTKHDDEKVGGDARRKKEAPAPLDLQAQVGSDSQHEVSEEVSSSGEGSEMAEGAKDDGGAVAGASQKLDGDGLWDSGDGAGEVIDGLNGRDETGLDQTPFSGEEQVNMMTNNGWSGFGVGDWLKPEDTWETPMAGTWTNTNQHMLGDDRFNNVNVPCTAAQPYPFLPLQAESGGRTEMTGCNSYHSGV